MDESLPQMFVFLGLSNKHSQYSKDKTQVESQLGKTLDLNLWIFTPPQGLGLNVMVLSENEFC